jgi:UDP-glucose 4-epimerase
MNVLVTGGAGYIGSATVALLLDEGHDVIVFDNLERGHREAIDDRARFIQGDLRAHIDIDSAMVNVKPDAVMHFAAFALVGESVEHPELYFRNNVVGIINLAEAMLRNDVGTIVFSSTCATYGEPDIVPIVETVTQRPTNPYGESKLMGETILKWYHERYGTASTFLRYFNACGATPRLGEDHDPESHLIPIILQVALGQRECVKVFGDDYQTDDGTCVRDYVHILDLARAHQLALNRKDCQGFNLGTGMGHSVREVLEVARQVTGHDIPAEVEARRTGDPAKLVAAAGKAREILNWEPAYSDLEQIMQTAWNWHQEHPRGYGG